MKKFILFGIFCLFATLGISQYHVYSDLANLSSQKIVQMNDGGYLIAAYEYCYTPHATAIEGCGFATHLVRTNTTGDTLWTKRIDQKPWNSKLFNNNDGSVTFIGTTNQSYSCDGFGVGLWGFSQVQVLHLNSDGELLHEIHFPDNCELVMKDVTDIGDQLFAVVGYYISPIFINAIPEGRLFIMNSDGEILNQITFEDEFFQKAKLIKAAGNELQLLYIKDDELHLDIYDYQLNLIHTASTAISENSCLQNGKFFVDQLHNGDLCVFCENYQIETDERVQFTRYDMSLNELAQNSFALNRITNFVEDEDEKIILASTYTTPDTIKNTMVTYFNYMGDSITSKVILNDLADERPNRMLLDNTDGDFVITGSVFCCNYDSIIGPGKSFLLLEDQITGLNQVEDRTTSINVYPNPTSNIVRIDLKELSKSGQINFRLFAPMGREVLSRRMNKFTFEVSLNKLNDGLYFYTISDNQKMLKSGKILKISK